MIMNSNSGERVLKHSSLEHHRTRTKTVQSGTSPHTASRQNGQNLDDEKFLDDNQKMSTGKLPQEQC